MLSHAEAGTTGRGCALCSDAQEEAESSGARVLSVSAFGNGRFAVFASDGRNYFEMLQVISHVL